MKQLLLSFCLITFLPQIHAQVGIGIATPHASSQLHIEATGKGLLIPRMTLANRPAAPADGLLYYQTDAPRGFWYYDGNAAAWKQLGGAWTVDGNAGTVAGTNFIGTTDNQPLVFKVNNITSGFLDNNLFNTFMGFNAGALGASGRANSAYGALSLASTSSGGYNTAIGASALYSNQTGSYNTGVGLQALYSNATSSYNTAVGAFALNETVASLNTAIGYNALGVNINGTENTALGAETATNNYNGNDNTAIGTRALKANSNGSYNTALGANTLTTSTGFSNNTAVGYNALAHCNASNNTALGYNALPNNTSGTYNTALGNNTLALNTTGNANLAAGINSLANNNGSDNVGVGMNTMIYATTGIQNTALGNWALAGNLTGSNNVAIGFQAGPTFNNLSNTITIGAGSPVSTSNTLVLGNALTATFGYYGTPVALSDVRFKRNIEPEAHGLDFILKLDPITYNLDVEGLNKHLYKPGADTMFTSPSMREAIAAKQRIRYSGFSAQQVEAAAKSVGYDFHAIHKPENEHDHYGLDYSAFVVPLVKAVQEQQQEIGELKAGNAALQTENAGLQTALKQQQQEIEQLKQAQNAILEKLKSLQ